MDRNQAIIVLRYMQTLLATGSTECGNAQDKILRNAAICLAIDALENAPAWNPANRPPHDGEHAIAALGNGRWCEAYYQYGKWNACSPVEQGILGERVIAWTSIYQGKAHNNSPGS